MGLKAARVCRAEQRKPDGSILNGVGMNSIYSRSQPKCAYTLRWLSWRPCIIRCLNVRDNGSRCRWSVDLNS